MLGVALEIPEDTLQMCVRTMVPDPDTIKLVLMIDHWLKQSNSD